MATKRVTAVIFQEGESFVAQCLDIEVASQGATRKEALVNLREALELYAEDTPIGELRPVLVTSLEFTVPD